MRVRRTQVVLTLAAVVLATSCGGGKQLASICSSQLQLQPSAANLSGNPSDVFMPNWNGLSGVLAGLDLGRAQYCRAYIEVVPSEEAQNPPKLFLWKKTECNPQGQQVLYLAFPKGYVKTQFVRKLAVTDPNKFVGEKTLDDIYKTRWPLSKDMADQFGPWSNSARPADSYDPYGHLVEEIELVPSTDSLLNEFLSLAIDVQIDRRRTLIPADAEADIAKYRGFFLNPTVVKRLLIEYSQSNVFLSGASAYVGYRYCSTGVWKDTASCQLTAQTIATKLSESVVPQLWSEISSYFAPTSATVDVAARAAQERSELNDVIRRLFRRELFQIRLPLVLPAELTSTSSAGKKPAFTDSYFTLRSESQYADEVGSSLQLSASPHVTGFLQLSGLQPTNYCSDTNQILFRKPLNYSDTDSHNFYVGAGSAEVSWAGLIPFARKRPQCGSCTSSISAYSYYCAPIPGPSSGGASILALPELGNDEMMSADSLQSSVTAARAQRSNPESTGDPARPVVAQPASKKSGGSCL